MRKAFNWAVYYLDPRENHARRVLCDFLVKQGLPDYFPSVAAWSNYHLECRVGDFGYMLSVDRTFVYEKPASHSLFEVDSCAAEQPPVR